MTVHAREVLRDCDDAVAELGPDLYGSLWRRRWATVVTLLRVVLHVLDKVDGETSPGMRQAIDGAWERVKATRPDPIILWEFIERDRNLLLKQYGFTAVQGVHVPFPDIQPPVPRATIIAPHMGRRGFDYTYTMTEPPFLGRYPREVAAEAVDWLRGYLDDVDGATA